MKDRRLYLLLALTMLPFSGAGVDIYAPSLPALTQYFSVSAEAVQATITAYLFGLCVGQIVYGTLSDSYGRRVTMIIGLSGFVAISWWITTVLTVDHLVFGRLCQGFFMGSMAANARSIVTDVYSKEEISHVAPYMSACWSLGPILAPLIGGYLQYYFSWQLSFDVLATYALALLLFVLFLEETNGHKRPFSVSTVLRSYLTVLKQSQYLGGLLLMAMAYFMLIVYALILPFIVQYTLHQTPVTYGNVTLLVGAAYLAGTLLNRLLLRRMAVGEVIKRGIIGMLLCSLMMGMIALFLPLTLVTVYLPIVLLTISVGLVFPGAMSVCLSTFPKQAGVASALAGSAAMLFTTIMSGVISAFHVKALFTLSLVFLSLSGMCLLVRWLLFIRAEAT